MTEPNYKELSRKFYVAMKHQSHRNDIPQYHELMREYEKLHKPKLTYVSCIAGDKFVYDNKDYALIGRFWYRIERTVLTFVEDDRLAEELITAYSEWEKSR
jgi:hypothetical protein